MIKVSIIVPIYNGEKYIEECIKSIQKQTFSNFEILLINDGSTDKSKNICEEISNNDKRVRFINQENRGVSKARNKGIELAKGEYITFIDCDDFIDSNYIEELYNSCIINKVKMSICGIRIRNIDRNTVELKQIEEAKYKSIDALYELFRFRNLNWGPCGKMIHKSLLVNEVKFPLIKIYEDLVFVYRAIYQCNELYFTNKCYYNYIHRDNIGAMNNFSQKPTTDIIVVANEVCNFLKKNTPEIWDSSFYGIISQVFMYVNIINEIDPKWERIESIKYIKETKKLLSNYRKELFLNRNIFFKEKIIFITFSFSLILYKNIIKINKKLN